MHQPPRAIDGYHILPGIVDLHGDGFERHLAPRRGALRDLSHGLAALDAELASNGVTTAVLAQFWSWEGGMRGPETARRLCEALSGFDALTEMRVQLRVEVSLYEDFPAILDLVDRFGIRYLALNDHLPHERLAAGKRPPRLEGQALKSGRSPADHLALLHRLHEGMPSAKAALPGFVAALRAGGVLVASHDDETPEARATARALGATVAEFPTTATAARAAAAAGDPVLLGAPNVVRGGSHDSRVSARALIAEGLCDALVSDYHYPALHRAAFALAEDGMTLEAAWALISDRPARLLHLDTDALVYINAATGRIEGTWASGRWSYLAGRLATELTCLCRSLVEHKQV